MRSEARRENPSVRQSKQAKWGTMRFPGAGTLIPRLLVCLLAAFVPAGGALAAPQASIVMDMRDGTVFHEDHADRRQHPASLTKMMTLYLVFEAIRDGRLSLDQRVRISSHASGQPPSKLHLRTGQRVTIRTLVRAAAIKSANDAAVALAEAVSGTESAFAQLMTARARELGMVNTTFRNANGLTQSGHLSTARDMAILGRHLFFDFPQYYNLFGRRNADAGGRTVWNTNRLLSSYAGADGIKTGYTRAAGYNLAASAVRGQERIIAVVLGGRSSSARNRRVAELLDLGFSRAPSRTASIAPDFHRGGSGSGRERVDVAAAPMPPVRPGSTVVAMVEPVSGSILERSVEALGEALAPASAEAATVPTALVVAPAFSDSRFAPAAASLPPRRTGVAVAAGAPRHVAARPVGSMPLPPRRPGSRSAGARPAGDWTVQLGAFADHEQAIAMLASATLGDVGHLAEAEPLIDERARQSGGKIYLVRFAGMSRTAARMACQEVRGHGGDCLEIAPGGRR